MKNQTHAMFPRRIEIAVIPDGFSPAQIYVKAGERVALAFTRQTDRTCATDVVVQLGDGRMIEKDLPLGETVEIDATFTKSGQLRYACSMDMITGIIAVE